MTDQTLKRKGGRPPLPPAPLNAGDCRTLVAAESVKTNPRERTLRHLYRLLKAFERAEVQAATELKTKALTDANELKAAELELKRAEYQRRFDLGPLGVKVMRQRIAELEERVRTLEAELTGNTRTELGVKSSESGVYAECTA
jgi:hypothetical protein